MGAPRADLSGGDSGGAYIFWSATAGDTAAATADAIVTGEGADRLGTSVALTGDIDGDGEHDLLLGAPKNDVNGGD